MSNVVLLCFFQLVRLDEDDLVDLGFELKWINLFTMFHE